MKIAAFVAGLALAGALVLAACYRGTPPCNPASVDWPRCDPTQPALALDGGAG